MRKLEILLCLTLMSVTAMVGCSCPGGDDSGRVDREFTYIDAHSQPPYPELGDSTDLEGIIELMDSSNVAVSILSARVEMRYSMDIASFAASHPDRIIAAVSLKLTGMDNSDQDFAEVVTTGPEWTIWGDSRDALVPRREI